MWCVLCAVYFCEDKSFSSSHSSHSFSFFLPVVLPVLVSILSLLSHQGKYGIALEYCGKALVIRIGHLGLQNQCTADSHYNIALLYRLNGDPAEAQREFKFARDIRASLNGPESLEVAEVDVSMGFTAHQVLSSVQGRRGERREVERRRGEERTMERTMDGW